MAKGMWLRCPECGGWCYAEKKNLFGRLIRSVKKGDKKQGEQWGELAEEYIGALKGFGKTVGRAINVINIYEHGGEMLNGDNYMYECGRCHNQFGTDDESLDMSDEYNLYKRAIELSLQFDKVKNLSNKDKQLYQKEIEETLAKIENIKGISDAKAILHDVLACCYFFFNNNSKSALLEINKSLNMFDDPQSHVLKGIFMDQAVGPAENYSKMNELLNIKECGDKIQYVDNSLVLEELERSEKEYGGNFISIPANHRKFLVITTDYSYLPDSFKVIKYNDTELSGIIFESGFPSNNAIYVCHPYKPNVYYPSETYRMDLFKNQLNELRELLQCLGAKSIKIENSQIIESNRDISNNLKGSISGGYKGVSGGLTAGHSSSELLMESMVDSMLVSDDFSFNPYLQPGVPEGLVWFDHMEEWQRLKRMRLRGQNKYSLSLSLKNTNIVNENEANQVNADFKALIANGNLEVSKSSELKAYESNSHEVTITVEFYPLSDYIQLNNDNSQSQSSFLLNGKDIIDQIKPTKQYSFLKNKSLIISFVILLGIIIALLFMFA